MRKVIEFEDLDCANCAAKIEEKIRGIDGVVSANVSFMFQTLTIEAEDEKIDDILKQAAKITKKIHGGTKLRIK